MRGRRLSAFVLILLVATACTGSDSDRRRTEAAEWCEQALYLDSFFDNGDGQVTPSAQITVTTASDWVEKAPSDIRDATERFATIHTRIDLTPQLPGDYGDVRRQISEYAQDYCPEPLDCIADVDGTPRLPCV
jgi:hypothetical protein